MIGPTVIHIVFASLSAVCCGFAIEFHTTTKETSKHTTYHVSNATNLFAMVGCLYCSSSSSFPFYDGWHFQYEEVTGNFDAASLPSVNRSWWLHCKYSRRAIIRINPSWLFVLLIFLIDGTYKSDWHVCLDCRIASYCKYNHNRWVSSQLERHMLLIVWVYSPTDQQQYASSCFAAWFIIRYDT